MDRHISASGIRSLRKSAYFPPHSIFILIFGMALKRFCRTRLATRFGGHGRPRR